MYKLLLIMCPLLNHAPIASVNYPRGQNHRKTEFPEIPAESRRSLIGNPAGFPAEFGQDLEEFFAGSRREPRGKTVLFSVGEAAIELDRNVLINVVLHFIITTLAPS